MASNKSYENKRTILIVVCSLLFVFCLLMLPRLCSTHPYERYPIPSKTIHREDSINQSIPLPNIGAVDPQTDNLKVEDTMDFDGGTSDNYDSENGRCPDDSISFNSLDISYFSESLDMRNIGDSVLIRTNLHDSSISKTPYSSDIDDGYCEGVGNNDCRDDETQQPRYVDSPSSSLSQTMYNDNQYMLIVEIAIFALLLVCYIIARVKLKQGTLVITANVFDKILIILSPILFFIVWCIGFSNELSPLQILLLGLSGVMLIVSILFSVFANLGNVWNILISVMAKLFIFVFTNILLFLLMVVWVFSILRTMMSRDNHEDTYIMRYDYFLDRWVGYRVD